MCVKEQHKKQHDACSGYKTQLKDSLIKEIETIQNLCKTKHLTHKQGIQHELQLMPKAPLPNVRMNQLSSSLEINRDTSQYWGKVSVQFLLYCVIILCFKQF